MNKVVVADRPDGLGERVRTILNAAYLAKVLGVEYKFTWNKALIGSPDHSIYPALKMFEDRFIESHLVPSVEKARFAELKGVYADSAAIIDAADGLDGWRVHQYDISRHLSADVQLQDGIYQDLFDAIEWAPSIKAAVSDAYKKASSRDTMASIHIRAGDIIFGRYRYSDTYIGKAISAPIARAIISSFAPAFDRFVVFSQDKDIASYLLKAAPNTVLAGDWSEQYEGAVERAIFEIALMSRCQLVIAGSSGFAQLAGKISDKRVRSAEALMSIEAQVDALSNAESSTDFRRCSALQQAFAAISLHQKAAHLGRNDVAAKALGRAIELDPQNPFYLIRRATIELNSGDSVAAEATLKAFLNKFELDAILSDGRWTPSKVLLDRSPGGRLRLEDDLAAIKSAAEAGSESAKHLIEGLGRGV